MTAKEIIQKANIVSDSAVKKINDFEQLLKEQGFEEMTAEESILFSKLTDLYTSIKLKDISYEDGKLQQIEILKGLN